MSLILATGSNLADKKNNLNEAKRLLSEKFKLIKASSIFESKAVLYENQNDFYNQVLEFELPSLDPLEVLAITQKIEDDFQRDRSIRFGPRKLDIDILFWNLDEINLSNLIIPHPRWAQRSFVVKPLQQLPFFKKVEKCFNICKEFEIDAYEIS